MDVLKNIVSIMRRFPMNAALPHMAGGLPVLGCHRVVVHAFLLVVSLG